MRCSRIAAALLFVAATARAQGEDPALLLDRLSRSMSELSYSGVLVFERDDHTQSLRLSHQVAGGREYERLEYLDGERREIIRSGSQLTCIHPGQRLIRLFQKQQLLREGLAELERFYTLKVIGEGRVAGRRTVNLEIVPRDEFRLGYRLALDHENGLLLRSELLGAGGRVLERFQFTAIDVGAEASPSWINTTSAPTAVSPATDSAAGSGGGIPAWQPQWLPPGFELALPVLPGTAGDVQTYSDGLAIVSIFVAVADEEGEPTDGGQAQQGATVAYTRPLRLDGRSYRITVLGEIPAAAARRIAAAVSWREPAS